MGSDGFVGVGFEWEISGKSFKEFVGVGQMGRGGFEEWVFGKFQRWVWWDAQIGVGSCNTAQIPICD